jgi:cell division protein FtsW
MGKGGVSGKIWKRKGGVMEYPNLKIAGYSLILIAIGIVASYSMPVYFQLIHNLPSDYFLKRQALYGVIGIVLILLVGFLNPDRWFKPLGWFLFLTAGFTLLLLPFLPESLVPVINGSRRWLKLGPIKVAPMEFLKVGFIFFLAWSFNRRFLYQELPFWEELKRIIPYLFILGIVSLLVVIFQSDLGQVIVITGVLFAMLLRTGRSLKVIAFLGGIAWVVGVIAILSAPYRYERLSGWFNLFRSNFLHENIPISTQQKYAQVLDSLYAVYHGGLWGQGLGNGIFKLGYLRDVHTDFVLAGLAEEIGAVGAIGIIVLMLLLIREIFRVAMRVEDEVYSMFAYGFGTMIGLQFFINIFGIFSVIPLKGITVPLISYGGSSLISTALGLGMVIMVSKSEGGGEW